MNSTSHALLPTRHVPLPMSRAAFTLLETALVLSLLVIMAALAWPALKGPMSGHRLRRSADQVRADWARARNRAMLVGETQAFLYLPGSGRFRIIPYADAQGTLQVLPAETTTATLGTSSANRFLPAGVVFVGSTAAPDITRSGPSARDQGAWSEIVLFYPDGTSTSVTVTLAGEDGRRISVELRGVTGGSRVGEIMAAEEVGR